MLKMIFKSIMNYKKYVQIKIKIKKSKEKIFNIFTFNILQINKLSNIFFLKKRTKKKKKMKRFMEGIGKKKIIINLKLH